MIIDYWVVVDKITGKVIAHCGSEGDAIMLFELQPDKRTYRKQKFIVDQVITVTSTQDKQLPGQIGLPQGKINLFETKKNILPENEQQPIII